MDKAIFQCAACGQWFKKASNLGPKRYTCSDRCRARLARGHHYLYPYKRHQYQQLCALCEQEFFSYRSDARTCGAKCRKALSRRKQSNARPPMAPISQEEIDRINELHRRIA
jgi:hypothetical protein